VVVRGSCAGAAPGAISFYSSLAAPQRGAPGVLQRSYHHALSSRAYPQEAMDVCLTVSKLELLFGCLLSYRALRWVP